jgi:hypothetical protein
MSSTHHSEASPPPSLSRPRPWSPDPTDPLPPLRSFRVQPIDNGWTPATRPYPRHDVASDPSIDTLDFADYARTLNPHPFSGDFTNDDYLLPPPPRSLSVASHAYSHASLNPPSLVSSRGIPTSQSHSTSVLRHTNHWPFPPSTPVTQPSVYIPSENAPYLPNILHPPLDAASSRGGVPNSEIDVSHFPAWSRGWYAKDNTSTKTEPQFEAPRASFFDPSYRAPGFARTPYDLYAGTHSSSSRDFVPWSSTDTHNYDTPLDPELKEERIRMLEHEFRSGPDVSAKEEPVGSVDEEGRLITDGPKKRIAIRIIEIVLALGIATSAVYAALVRWLPSFIPASVDIGVTVDQDRQPPTTSIEAPYVCAVRIVHPHIPVLSLPLPLPPLLLWGPSEATEPPGPRPKWTCSVARSGAIR